MRDIVEMRQARAALVSEAHKILDQAYEEKRDLTAEEEEKYKQPRPIPQGAILSLRILSELSFRSYFHLTKDDSTEKSPNPPRRPRMGLGFVNVCWFGYVRLQ
ncbi:hypothetical protein [Thermoflavimicrobium daqui]|uniref:Uncharacterized protein n=1 Tax=Thermoflavimicrobium daqui TaxID=2137476 RepID=A0A364K6M7_9BACL|nr:hypothetical protein [Thermoflavimicrobium daqui]RAL25961.1 hypothetical protein DL897_07800 [Thermoflavimicrobium daqui]